MSEIEPPTYVNGRRALIQAIDVMLAKEHNIRRVVGAMEDLLDTHPLTFFKEVFLPLMPRDGLGLSPEDDAKNSNQHIMIEFTPAPLKIEAKETESSG